MNIKEENAAKFLQRLSEPKRDTVWTTNGINKANRKIFICNNNN